MGLPELIGGALASLLIIVVAIFVIFPALATATGQNVNFFVTLMILMGIGIFIGLIGAIYASLR
jgi:hypothetical protein